MVDLQGATCLTKLPFGKFVAKAGANLFASGPDFLKSRGGLFNKKTLQKAKFKIKLSDAFSFVMWSTIPPMTLKAILDPLKCQMEAFYCINQKPHLSSQTNGVYKIIY